MTKHVGYLNALSRPSLFNGKPECMLSLMEICPYCHVPAVHSKTRGCLFSLLPPLKPPNESQSGLKFQPRNIGI